MLDQLPNSSINCGTRSHLHMFESHVKDPEDGKMSSHELHEIQQEKRNPTCEMLLTRRTIDFDCKEGEHHYGKKTMLYV
ncbi:hypothetical protein CDAR_15381 [Caerostris darwini]|uniref:Uncharacterized protein n=1 Tax=Caerostris darwini TaxID=1538125 RepID=A0AAV4S289_9ARAC|nr:hypothetical protein CDAR_15381 [Caerostris darwini]